MSNKAVAVYAEAMKRKQEEEKQWDSKDMKTAPKATQEPTRVLDSSRDNTRDTLREDSRGMSRDFPTRDEIQEFNFRLRDDLKVKVQAEVPHQWQKELEGIARELNVKKLELYRFIIGEFLGKVERKKAA